MTSFKQLPLKLKFTASTDSLSFQTMAADETALPLPPHPGAFGVTRKHHIHEGIDLYCPNGTPVYAVEDGIVQSITPFTGKIAGSDWWHDTYAALVHGDSGTVVYGEITPSEKIAVGQKITAGKLIGHVAQVLKKDKGRPMSMLHLELYDSPVKDAAEWLVGSPCPKGLIDPTPYLTPLLKK